MTAATSARAPAHVRIHCAWLEFPTWRALSLAARNLLVEILADYRPKSRFGPGNNGRLSWPARRAAERLGVSKATGARALIELERNGWITVSTVSAFGGRAKPATYAVTMFLNDVTGEPASFAFEHLPGEPARKDRKRKTASQAHGEDKAVPLVRLNGFTGRTTQSQGEDTLDKSDGARAAE